MLFPPQRQRENGLLLDRNAFSERFEYDDDYSGFKHIIP